MDKTGLIALIIGLVLCIVGGYAVWAFLPEVIIAVKGLIGIAIAICGLMLLLFGLLIIRD